MTSVGGNCLLLQRVSRLGYRPPYEHTPNTCGAAEIVTVRSPLARLALTLYQIAYSGGGYRVHSKCRGENGADGPTALDPQAPPHAARQTDFATDRQPSCSYPIAGRSRRCYDPRRQAAPASLATPHDAAGCNTPRDAQAPCALTPQERSPGRLDPASPTRFAAKVMTPSTPTAFAAGGT